MIKAAIVTAALAGGIAQAPEGAPEIREITPPTVVFGRVIFPALCHPALVQSFREEGVREAWALRTEDGRTLFKFERDGVWMLIQRSADGMECGFAKGKIE